MRLKTHSKASGTTSSHRDNPSHHRSGFALIVTVSLLVLLALIAVGLLTLSTVTVRSATHGSAKAEARPMLVWP